MRACRLVLLVIALAGTAARRRPASWRRKTCRSRPSSPLRGKNKLCCGYPLAEDHGFALRFYWLSLEADYDENQNPAIARTGACALPRRPRAELYTPEGFFFGRVPERFACSLKLEGSGLMRDGRVVNYTGPCKYGYGTCFEQLDIADHPFGRGAGQRPLVPFKSVAVDPRLVPIGEPIYIPEFDGMVLPDGSIHDGCVRADDTGGGIKGRKMDFFVVTYGNFRVPARRAARRHLDHAAHRGAALRVHARSLVGVASRVLDGLFVTPAVTAIVEALASAKRPAGSPSSATRSSRRRSRRSARCVPVGDVPRAARSCAGAIADLSTVEPASLAAVIGVDVAIDDSWESTLRAWSRVVRDGGALVLVDRGRSPEASRRALCAGLTELEQRRAGRVVVTSGLVTQL